MSETPLLETTRPAPSRDWGTKLIVLLSAAAVGGALYYTFGQQRDVNQQVAAMLHALQTAQQSEGKMSADEATALRAVPTQLADLNKATSATNEQLGALTSRFDAIEKAASHKTDNAGLNAVDLRQFLALKSAINRGDAYVDALESLKKSPAIALAVQPLAEHATTGVPTDAALRTQLQHLLTAPAPTASNATTDAPPHSITARLNAEFAGMLHIAHHAPVAPDHFSNIREHLDAQSPLALLVQDVKMLPSDGQKPFAEWLSQAHTRMQVENILAQIETALAAPVSAP